MFTNEFVYDLLLPGLIWQCCDPLLRVAPNSKIGCELQHKFQLLLNENRNKKMNHATDFLCGRRGGGGNVVDRTFSKGDRSNS
jgi:hypothetical protein